MTNTFDTIVVGAGMAGGWAAKEFTEQGFKTLLLERGPNVKHLEDYPTANMLPWEFKHRGQLTTKEISLIKLVKAEEFLEDLYGSTIYPQTNDMFPPKDSYNKIKGLLKELRKLNK